MSRGTLFTLRLAVFAAALAVTISVLAVVDTTANPRMPVFASRDIPKGDVDCYQWPRGNDIRYT